MNYEIQSRSDFKAGTELVVYIPEAELDSKALYTILTDRPGFVLPFRHRSVDGQIELTYQVGRLSKLNYLAGSRSPAEYAQLWSNLLQPLLDCDDWFMNPHCFVFQADYLYCDKATMDISYLYVPTLQPVSDQNMLKSMITEVARRNRVTDTNLENKVIWAIQDFNIQDFLQIIKPYQAGSVPASAPVNGRTYAPSGMPSAPVNSYVPPSAPSAPGNAYPPPGAPSAPVNSYPPLGAPSAPVQQQRMPGASPAAQAGSMIDAARPEAAEQGSLDIFIQIPENGKPPKDNKSRGGLFKKKEKKEKEKKEKVEKPPREKTKQGGKKNSQVMQGAASQPIYSDPAYAPVTPAGPVYPDAFGVTVIDSGSESAGPHFRYIGVGGHPAVIQVLAQPGEIFTIGRFDVSVGVKQSSFEFEGRTKAVSRRHAAVERGVAGYHIVDLDSSAGTFLNGQRLPPNAPFPLEPGCRVSFGNAGADYIWEA